MPNKNSTAQTVSVRERFALDLAEQIINGELKAGDRLPPERELAEEAGISKSNVHLALTDLKRMGFIEMEERQGNYVADFAAYGNVNTLEILTKSSDFEYDADKIRDILEMREGIENQALIRLADNLTEENKKKIRSVKIDAEKYVNDTEEVDVRTLAQYFFEFHHTLCVCSGNFVLPLLFNTFRESTTYFWEQPIREFGVEAVMRDLQEMYDAVMTGSSETSIAYFHHEMEVYRSMLPEHK